jgi:hypothetical protein
MIVRGDFPRDIAPYDRYCVSVGLKDVKTGRVQPIGAVEGGWSMLTSAPYPAIDIAWADDRSDTPAGAVGTCRHEVDPTTGVLLSCISARRPEETCPRK